MTALRPRLPKWNVPSAETGSANTELDVHEPAIRGSHTELANHWVGSPMIVGSPIRSGRSELLTPVNWPWLVTMLIGLPLCACVIADSCQPVTNALPVNGRS